MNSVPKHTMDNKKVWAMELTRDHIRKLSDSFLLRHQQRIEANRDITKLLLKTAFFACFFHEIMKIKPKVAFFMA
jgi:hypothetical protein